MADDSFLHWFAGFLDGEGCFKAYISKTGQEVVAVTICLRSDDHEILAEIAGRLGGNHYRYETKAYWSCSSKADNLRLMEILEQYPLRAKKKHDYQLWRCLVVAKAVGARLSDFADVVQSLSHIKQFDGVKKHEAAKADQDKGQDVVDPEASRSF